MVSAEMANYIPLGAAALCRPRFRDVDRVERGTQGSALKLNSATLLPRLAHELPLKLAASASLRGVRAGKLGGEGARAAGSQHAFVGFYGDD